MNNLLNDVTAGKRAFQRYVIEHGIERITVKIPIKNTRQFESEFQTALTEGVSSKESLFKIVKKNSGLVEGKKE